jgi:hypothetical protein
VVELPPEEEKALEPENELFAIEQMLARRADYDQVMAALDDLIPGDDQQALASIAHTRLTAASMYHRDESEIARAIEAYMALEPVMWRRLSAVLAACVDSPDLFGQYVEPLITEAEIVEIPDDPLRQVLETAKRVRQRLAGTT